MLRYLGDVKKTPQHRTKKIKGKDPADQLNLLRGRITGDEYDKLLNKVRTIQQEEAKGDEYDKLLNKVRTIQQEEAKADNDVR